MRRQKTDEEILKRIREIEEFIATDEELSCGFAPAGFYDDLCMEINMLEEQLIELQRYK